MVDFSEVPKRPDVSWRHRSTIGVAYFLVASWLVPGGSLRSLYSGCSRLAW